VAIDGATAHAGGQVRTEDVPDQADRARQLRRAMVASTIGATIEWYDFFLYSTVTGLVFAKLYFPESDPLIGTLQAFAVYAVGFIARPVGAFVFGHYGDRIGRKATLISTLLLMGLATTAVAFVPTYEQIGIWGAVLLVVLRFLQGVGVGGEWSGGVLLAMEWAGPKNRGFASSWPQFGSPAGLLLANLAVFAFSRAAGDEFLTWGWRVPFLLSVFLIGVGLYMRLGVEETPAFAKLAATEQLEKTPILAVLKNHWKPVVYTILARTAELTPYYIFTAYIFTYGTTVLGVSRDLLLSAVMAASLLSFFTIPFAGWLSDRIGRKKVILFGAVSTAVMGVLYFAMVNTRDPVLIVIATILALIPHDLMWGPLGAFISENFPAKVRYSGASIGGQLAAVFSGGWAPLISAALFAAFNSAYAIAGYIVVCAAISVVGISLLRDFSRQAMPDEE